MSHNRSAPPARIKTTRRKGALGTAIAVPWGPWCPSVSRWVVALAALNGPVLALAQTAADQSTTTLSEVVVTAQRMNYNGANELSLDKLTQPLVDTPQSISSISAAQLADQGVSDLNDALRTVAGITLGAGETSWQGNNAYLRGFTTRDDIFLDGQRDFGYYYRDPFDDQNVEVLEGPSSILFGRGSTGGVINQVSKSPTLNHELVGTASVGSDNLQRATLDFDTPIEQLGTGAAFRLNLMGDRSDVADRDTTQNQRWGAAPSLALGLGTATRLDVSYFHQTANDTPDDGIPWFAGRPAPVRYANYYGFASDYLDTDVNILTARFEHDFNASMTLSSQARYSVDSRHFRMTEADVVKGTPATTPVQDITVTRTVFQGYGTASFAEDQTDLTTRIRTGAISHAIATGIEVGRENPQTTYITNVGAPSTSLAQPTVQPYSVAQSYTALDAQTVARSAGVYALDTLQWGKHLQLLAGGREDLFDAPYSSTQYSPAGTAIAHTAADQVNRIFSYRAALVYTAGPRGSVYATTGTSFDPSAEGIDSLISSGRALAQANLNLAPEKTRTYELGSKWELADNQLLLSGALFRLEEFNARVPNPDNPQFDILGGDERVDGAQAEASGHITRALTVDVSYTYLDSSVIRSTPGGPLLGAPLTNAPRTSSALWLQYQIDPPLQVAIGTLQATSQLGQDTPSSYEVAPGYVVLNAMAKYLLSSRAAVQLNLNNLTNKSYIEEVHPFHAVPGEGFVALLSVTLQY